MSLILGMDIWVFAAWILTILSAIFCVIYGLYYEFLKKPLKNNEAVNKKHKTKEPEVK